MEVIVGSLCALIVTFVLLQVGRIAYAKIKLRWADFTTLTRQVTLEQPTNLDDDIYAAALQLFEKTWPPGKRSVSPGCAPRGHCSEQSPQ